MCKVGKPLPLRAMPLLPLAARWQCPACPAHRPHSLLSALTSCTCTAFCSSSINHHLLSQALTTLATGNQGSARHTHLLELHPFLFVLKTNYQLLLQPRDAASHTTHLLELHHLLVPAELAVVEQLPFHPCVHLQPVD